MPKPYYTVVTLCLLSNKMFLIWALRCIASVTQHIIASIIYTYYQLQMQFCMKYIFYTFKRSKLVYKMWDRQSLKNLAFQFHCIVLGMVYHFCVCFFFCPLRFVYTLLFVPFGFICLYVFDFYCIHCVLFIFFCHSWLSQDRSSTNVIQPKLWFIEIKMCFTLKHRT